MTYKAVWWLKNGHIQSIYPSLFRRLNDSFLERERIDTPDGDFIDLDWSRSGNQRLVILTHGLEGHSRRPYMLGMATEARTCGWDVLAWNFRSCSGEPNRRLASYHSGAIEDLDTVIRYALTKGYRELALIGFSIGGNKILLYLGKELQSIPTEIVGAVVFSVPCDLSSSSAQLARPKNILYMRNFLLSFKQKLLAKQRLYPQEIDLTDYHKIKNFRDFDNRYTAPLNGFNDAQDYWRQCSSKQVIDQIKVPTLMISAQDDPFLTPECFPHREALRNTQITLETPKHGGHVGFMKAERYWSEHRAFEYLDSIS